jgi:SAM-dependent methyltransferase
MERGNLVAGSRVLEVGCGTGKLTELLVERGLLVDAVDPGANMIAAARRRLGETDAVSFHLGRFEDVSLPEGAFACAFSATAFHWVDPEIAWPKVASHLEAGGMLALLTHRTLRDEQAVAIQEEFLEMLHEYAPDIAAGWRPLRDLDVLVAGARERRGNASDVWDWLMGHARLGLGVPVAADLFEDVDVASELWSVERTADQALAHIRTTSLYYRIDPARRQAFEEDERRLVERHGGIIRSSFATLLMTARKRPVKRALERSLYP